MKETPMIDRAMAQQYKPKTYNIIQSREGVLAAVIRGLEALLEDATDTQSVLNALEAVRKIK